ncbi:dipeptide/tripeptide permease [Methylophilales bacterium HTCC2181]|uniref:Dipeptide/tripeptide permease n=1 Tax=Methylophilales bacterium HTCC2181 TaxID=383631 RepID=A0P711_9PROT|nr:dipeptide/tripeptide permease [Methylophilales bacterium HTCC2181]
MENNNTLSQPKSLRILFLTEMWERFSYYGMRALLVLYLVQSQGYSAFDAMHIYAIYTGLVYLTPVIGGYLADHYLGQQKSILIGGITMMFGHLFMANPSTLNLALGLLIIGNGFFKPNISSLLGGFYLTNDARRDGGYSFFYVGINMGAFIAPLLIGYVGEVIDWHYGFVLAAVGMFMGLLHFSLNQKQIASDDLTQRSRVLSYKEWWQVMALALLNIPIVLLVLTLHPLLTIYQNLIWLSIFLIVTYVVLKKRSLFQAVPSHDLKRIIYIAILSLFVIFFWVGFEQAGGSLTLFAHEKIDRQIMSFIIPASFFQSVNPLIIIFLGPLMANIWLRIDRGKLRMSTPQKMGSGIMLLGLGFLLLSVVSQNQDSKISLWWLVMVYFCHTLGELCLSPIGLSMVSKVSPKKLVSIMMGFWFLSSAIANYMAGRLPELLVYFNINLFSFLTATSLLAGLLLYFMAPFLENLIRK